MKNSKPKKKLSLSRETLTSLTKETLTNVAGGDQNNTVTCFYCTGHCPSWPKGCRPKMEEP